ncbi:MAG: tetratricopeptide repeat protein [Bacteroidales bacterium]|nr:tetratricopeptide repeat protein [Bacteroidales bacterium]
MKTLAKLLYIIIFAFGFLLSSFAQNSTKDSILHIIEFKKGNEKALLYHQISKAAKEPDSILKYGQLSLVWAKESKLKEQKGDAYKSIGVAYHLSSHYSKAISYYDSALIFLNSETQANAIARTYSNKSGIFIRLKSLDSAIYNNELCNQFAQLTNDKDLGRIYLKKKANIFSLQGKHNESILALKECQEKYTLGTRSLIINLIDIGINFFDLGDIDSALYYYEKAEALEVDLFPKDKISLLSNKANAYIFIGDHENSIKSFIDAIEIADSIDYDYGRTLLTSNLANMYYEWDEFEKAIQVYKQSMNYLQEHGIYNNLLIVYLNIGISYNSISLIDSSLIYLEKAKEICLQTDNKSLLAPVYHNFGRCYFAKDEYKLAVQYYQLALEANKRDHNINTKANIYHDMALSYAELGKYQQALSLTDSAQRMYLRSNNIKQSIDIMESLALIMEKGNNYKGAYQQLKLYMQKKDSLFNKEKYKQISELETQYKTAQKEAQIQKQLAKIADDKLLINKEKNKALNYAVLFSGAAILMLIILIFLLRNKQKHQLVKNELEQKQMEMEGRLLRSQMNPHFIFNSLNSIQSYITSNDQYHAETYLSKFAKLMRSILENSRHAFVSLEQDLSTLMIYMELEHLRFEGQFQYDLDVDEKIDFENTYIPPMLIQPYIENAIVHGLVGKLEKKGQLNVSFELLNENAIKCIVEDNGIGREKAMELKKRSIKPYESLGMQVTKERMQVISEINKVSFKETFFDLKDEHNEAIGTRVELIIPIEKD